MTIFFLIFQKGPAIFSRIYIKFSSDFSVFSQNFFISNLHTNLLYFLQKFVIIFSTDSSKCSQNVYRYLLYLSLTNFFYKIFSKNVHKIFFNSNKNFLTFSQIPFKEKPKLVLIKLTKCLFLTNIHKIFPNYTHNFLKNMYKIFLKIFIFISDFSTIFIYFP